jgi:hypothetical protein
VLLSVLKTPEGRFPVSETPAQTAEREAFLSLLADAESALRGNDDDKRWAADIPVPLLQEDVAASDFLSTVVLCEGENAQRFDVVCAAAREFALMDADGELDGESLDAYQEARS